jgi:hypothetical protein
MDRDATFLAVLGWGPLGENNYSGCGRAMPFELRVAFDRERGGARIEFFKDSIECEIAAAAADPNYSRFKLSTWNVKTGLDLTIIDTAGGDGKASAAIPRPTLPTISPAAGITGKFTHTGHIDFATSVPDAITRFGKTCAGPNPSQSNLGLAAWIAATLDRIEPEDHGGLSFTVDVDVTIYSITVGAVLSNTITRPKPLTFSSLSTPLILTFFPR